MSSQQAAPEPAEIDLEGVGQALLFIRNRLQLNQLRFAGQLGMSVERLRRIEKGKVLPKLAEATDWRERLHVEAKLFATLTQQRGAA